VKLCDLTLATPEENLACDEALLDLCEASHSDEVLRFWEPVQYFVVLGYANKVEREVVLPFCRANTIPILRRCTGGGTVLQGPGVLNYSLLLRIDDSGPLHSIAATNEFIMDRHQQALAPLIGARVEGQGHTDLAIGGLKFSGNAQRRQRHFLLFHGSFLLSLDIGLVEKALPLPSRQPSYRASRSHANFLLNLNLPAPALKSALSEAWQATEPLSEIPSYQIERLVGEKYALDEWNLKF
jgi:lipoate---protein ligase